MTGREWGRAADGLVLSVSELGRDDRRQVAGISVVMKNEGTLPRSLTVPPWIFFYQIEGLELAPYGRQLMSPGRQGKDIEVTLGPGDAIETDLPLATIYDLRAPGNHKIRVSCRLPGQTVLRSNELTIQV